MARAFLGLSDQPSDHPVIGELVEHVIVDLLGRGVPA